MLQKFIKIMTTSNKIQYPPVIGNVTPNMENISQYDHVLYESEYIDLSNLEALEMEEDIMELSPSLLVPFAVVLASLLIIGVVGNILVISILIKARLKEHSRSLMPMSTTTNAYILNLSAADLLFLLFCAPFQGTVYILNHWPYGWFMCKAAHYLQSVTVYASIWVLTTMSVDRYVAIGHPLKSVKWRHPRQAMRISAVVWIAASLLSLPWLILYEADERETANGQIRIACYDAWSESTYRFRKWMILLVFLIGFLIPSCIIFCMAILVAKSIKMATHEPLTVHNAHHGSQILNDTTTQYTSRKHGKISIGGMSCGGTAMGVRLSRRRRVGWLVFALAFLFFLCWIPHNLSLLWLNFDSHSFDWVYNNYQTFFIIKLIAHMMTYINSCMNPMLYSLASKHFRRRLVHGCRNIFTRRQSSTSNNCPLDNRTYLNNGHGSILFRSTCAQATNGLVSSASIRRRASTVSMAKKISFSTFDQRQQLRSKQKSSIDLKGVGSKLDVPCFDLSAPGMGQKRKTSAPLLEINRPF